MTDEEWAERMKQLEKDSAERHKTIPPAKTKPKERPARKRRRQYPVEMIEGPGYPWFGF